MTQAPARADELVRRSVHRAARSEADGPSEYSTRRSHLSPSEPYRHLQWIYACVRLRVAPEESHEIWSHR